MVDTADDYTEFNADYPVRLDGKALNSRLSEATTSDGFEVAGGRDAELAKVQVYGDTAVLTYNFVGVIRDKDGKVSPNKAKSTRVYSRVGGKWMLVHDQLCSSGLTSTPHGATSWVRMRPCGPGLQGRFASGRQITPGASHP